MSATVAAETSWAVGTAWPDLLGHGREGGPSAALGLGTPRGSSRAALCGIRGRRAFAQVAGIESEHHDGNVVTGAKAPQFRVSRGDACRAGRPVLRPRGRGVRRLGALIAEYTATFGSTWGPATRKQPGWRLRAFWRCGPRPSISRSCSGRRRRTAPELELWAGRPYAGGLLAATATRARHGTPRRGSRYRSTP
jgi:hypothetical protein